MERLRESAADPVSPEHYKYGNVEKYVARAGRKGDAITDPRKAETYLRWAIEREEPLG